MHRLIRHIKENLFDTILILASTLQFITSLFFIGSKNHTIVTILNIIQIIDTIILCVRFRDLRKFYLYSAGLILAGIVLLFLIPIFIGFYSNYLQTNFKIGISSETWMNFMGVMIGSVITVFAAFLVIRIQQKQERVLYSPKPFLRPISYKVVDGLYPEVEIENCGPGHAINITVKVYLNQDCLDNEKHEKYTEYYGPSIIPFSDIRDIRKAIYTYQGKRNVAITDKKYILIEYENDSGYKGNVEWKYDGNVFIAIDGR